MVFARLLKQAEISQTTEIAEVGKTKQKNLHGGEGEKRKLKNLSLYFYDSV